MSSEELREQRLSGLLAEQDLGEPTLRIMPAPRVRDLPDAILYSLWDKAHDRDAGYDLRYVPAEGYEEAPCKVGARPQVLGTGIHVAIPEGYMGEIRPRSGLSKEGVYCALGTIDSGYTGELMVTLQSPVSPYTVQPFERIAQLTIVPVLNPNVELVQSLEESERGEGGHGSSGRL